MTWGNVPKVCKGKDSYGKAAITLGRERFSWQRWDIVRMRRTWANTALCVSWENLIVISFMSSERYCDHHGKTEIFLGWEKKILWSCDVMGKMRRSSWQYWDFFELRKNMKLQCIRNDGAIIMALLKCLCKEKGIRLATLVLISEEW